MESSSQQKEQLDSLDPDLTMMTLEFFASRMSHWGVQRDSILQFLDEMSEDTKLPANRKEELQRITRQGSFWESVVPPNSSSSSSSSSGAGAAASGGGGGGRKRTKTDLFSKLTHPPHLLGKKPTSSTSNISSSAFSSSSATSSSSSSSSKSTGNLLSLPTKEPKEKKEKFKLKSPRGDKHKEDKKEKAED
jgi:hypothetical protein